MSTPSVTPCTPTVVCWWSRTSVIRARGYYSYEYTNDRLKLIRFEEWDTSWNRGE